MVVRTRGGEEGVCSPFERERDLDFWVLKDMLWYMKSDGWAGC